MSPRRTRLLALGALALAATAVAAGDRPSDRTAIRFDRDIAPILSNNCYACHGPDAAQRKAKLRLDVREEALADRDGEAAIVPGDPEASLVVQRISASEPDDVMPPPKTGKKLSVREIELLRAWIAEGAKYTRHWSFEAPRKADVPPVHDAKWPRNAIDAFVLARLESERLAPTPEAEREKLLRRVSLTLTGLPPSLAELDAFLADSAPDAYERAVERTLASPRYGEHMARMWLDAARYGDTHGLHLDNERSQWPWREWVIAKFNANQGFDQFTVEQLAGDMLPDASAEQKLATGFNRCNPSTGEGGLIADEYLAKYAMDRVDTTSTVWMGLTMACAKCHDHKFDALSQADYYRMLSIFDDVVGEASDENALAPAPSMRVPTAEDDATLARLTSEVGVLQSELNAPMQEVDAAQQVWEAERAAELERQWLRPTVVAARSQGGATLRVLDDGSVLAEGENPKVDEYEVELEVGERTLQALMLEVLPHESCPGNGLGRAYNANFVLTDVAARAGERDVKWASAEADHAQDTFGIAFTIDDRPDTGWAALPREKEPHVALFVPLAPIEVRAGERLVVRLAFKSVHEQHAFARFRISLATDPSARAIELGAWSTAGPFPANNANKAYDDDLGPEKDIDAPQVAWIAHPEFVDGVAQAFKGDNSAVYLRRKLVSPSARRVELALGSDDALKVWLDGVLVHANPAARALKLGEDRVALDLTAGEHELLFKVVNYSGDFAFVFEKASDEIAGAPLAIVRVLATNPRTEADDALLRTHYRTRHSPGWKDLAARHTAKATERTQAESAIAQTLTMSQREMPRPTRILSRGQYDQPGDEVASGLPASLPPLADGLAADRLGLARWLTSGAHPLTARVLVNRLWQQHFGVGLVATAEDFGVQGERPSHPELLDWLAVELVESGWDVKHLQRLIVTSATFRQSSRATPELLERDPANRLLARGPRWRLEAEVIRDQALAQSGLLVEKLGGKSVKPYQPGNLWKVVGFPGSNTENFVQGEGDALWRRSLYTFWKRTAPPANLQTFDAPSREVCTVRRERTNTPLQALVLLNDVQFIEAARALAQRMLREPRGELGARVSHGFRLATARWPSDGERRELEALYVDQLAHFRGEIDAAFDLLDVGDSESDPRLDVCEHAAMTIVASVLLNLDEVLNLE